jgi:hypothetical protein
MLNSSLIHPEERLSGAMLMPFFWHILILPVLANQVMLIKRVTALLVKSRNMMEAQVPDQVILGSTGCSFSFREKELMNN